MRSLAPNPRLLRHSTVVAEIAAFLCSAMARHGTAVDEQLAVTAALLHDLDKMLPESDPLKALGHGPAGAEWLRQHGHPELAEAVASHPVMTIGNADSYEAWAETAGLAGQIVAYADKRGRQRQITVHQRFARWHTQYPQSPPLELAHMRVERLETEICAMGALKPTDVARTRWVAKVMRAKS